MKCPNCTDTELVNRRREWLSVDLCPSCHGTWLPRSDFERLMLGTQRAQDIVDDDWSRERQRREFQSRGSFDYDDDHDERSRYAHRDVYRRKSWLRQFRDLID